MAKHLQKTANRLCELELPHPGILDPVGFHQYFELHCYKPSDDLAPFLTHVWTQRERKPIDAQYHPTEVLSGPNFYIFVTQHEAFIHGIVEQQFDYDTREVAAGVKFKPGGFAAFFDQSLSGISHQKIPLDTVFPEMNAAFTQALLQKTDHEIVNDLERILREKQPHVTKQLEMVRRVMNLLETDQTLQTVRQVARRFGRSERSLQQLFHEHVGVSLKWALTRRRLLNTVNQLHSQSSQTWTEAAAEQGYSSQSHFTREFKNAVGQLPSQYIRRIT